MDYRNKKANITFQIPSIFTLEEESDEINPCDYTVRLLYETYSDPNSYGKKTRYYATVDIQLTKEKFDKTNQENRFFRKENQWIARSLVTTSLANVKADSVQSSNWFGLEATIYTPYHYKEGGRSSSAGTGYSFFAIKEVESDCKTHLLFDNFKATQNKIGQKIISTLERIN